MRFWKAIGGLLVFVGCLVSLTGILATAAPMIDNVQVQKIIESFSVVSQDAVINMLNGVILFCLHHNYWLFGAGAASVLIGGLIKTVVAKALGAAQGVRKPDEKGGVYKARPSSEKTATPATQKPGRRESRKTDVGFSPYAAAEYGKALAGGHEGRVNSDIATKYKPRSIINTPDTDGETLAASLWGDPSSYGKGGERTLANTSSREYREPAREDVPPERNPDEGINRVKAQKPDIGEIICTACGARNTGLTQFCEQCGSKLPDVAAKRAIANDGIISIHTERSNPWEGQTVQFGVNAETRYTARTPLANDPYPSTLTDTVGSATLNLANSPMANWDSPRQSASVKDDQAADAAPITTAWETRPNTPDKTAADAQTEYARSHWQQPEAPTHAETYRAEESDRFAATPAPIAATPAPIAATPASTPVPATAKSAGIQPAAQPAAISGRPGVSEAPGVAKVSGAKKARIVTTISTAGLNRQRQETFAPMPEASAVQTANMNDAFTVYEPEPPTPATVVPQQPTAPRPRIVSTMGKKSAL